MLTLTNDLVAIGQTATDKADAIAQAVDLLTAAGKIDPRYGASMMGREQVANTFLGNGIAIPHGLPKDRDLIHDTAIAVVQIPAGVDWGSGDRARLVVAIAARSDEHLAVLTNLTDVLGDDAVADKLATTTDVAEIVARLTGQAPANDTATAPATDLGDSFTVTIAGPHGLHARPATALVTLAKGYDADIRLRHGDKVGNAKSLISLLRLGADQGAEVTVSAEGPQAPEALDALRAAFAQGLEDERDSVDDAPAGPAPVAAALDWEGKTLPGISSSPGYALAPVFQFLREDVSFATDADDPSTEQARLDAALQTAWRQLEALYEDVWKKSGPAKAQIFRAHQEFLGDPEMIEAAAALIAQGRSAGFAWNTAVSERADMLSGMPDATLAARAADLRDVGLRVLKQLGEVTGGARLPDQPCILVADDLTPSDTAQLDKALVKGLCTASGGPTSHTSIIARALDIPAVVGAGPAVLDLANGTAALLDGTGGGLVLDPTAADTRHAEAAMNDLVAQRETEARDRFKPAITTDGARVEVVANISDVAEATAAIDAGGEGVGLLRTEFLFVNRDHAPTEDEQVAIYSAMLDAMNGLPIIIRTLDVGGDKEIPYLRMPVEENPFLGTRGIRFCLTHEAIFRTQLRAIFRASARGPVRIMFPMVAMTDELDDALRIAEEVRAEVGAEHAEMGIMIEVPSAVMMAPELARRVDFFSIGTNDLTQYALAMDRMHPTLARKADGLHPAVLRLIDQTVKAAARAGIWVGACGGVAGDPLGARILAGLGLVELSVSIPSIPSVKAELRATSMEDNRALAGRALGCADAAAVRALA
ncbi:PTS fructose transporter subunit IIA [Salipiger aestuarii]|uniref:Multiphosphoryl transfer protein n=1 Tax=Salipiger aestuarii TaxID=568098 RepID=A0A327Y2H8_9RHOB|nr:phosphoenolpyruvate--protein phosphotransferase [Salipiger aestuarii]KAB2541287.1 PTS fructose transporter subunit IIA [Salipiger aestuarii]RAK13945.1 phosphocarrier protein FPr [Salipiger aestuarii]